MSRANIFLLVNLGSEMLYIIDQRLKAQCVSLDKSTQVLRDITSVLFDPKFMDRIMVGNQQQALITPEHCRIMLTDIACCSLMRMDEKSMDKLWDLLTMVFKWQVSVVSHPNHILDITYRHLNGVAQLHPEDKKTVLMDYTKSNLVDFWNIHTDDEQQMIYETIVDWLRPFNIKISILIRLGFQSLDGDFIREMTESYAKDFMENVGDNIYMKSMQMVEAEKLQEAQANSSNKLADFEEQLNIKTSGEIYELNRNTILDDIGIALGNSQLPENDDDESSKAKQTEFVKLNTVHHKTNTNSTSWETVMGQNKSFAGVDLKTLLNAKLS